MTAINGFNGYITDFVRGTTKDFSIKLSKNGIPIDITGCKFYITFSLDQTSETEPELEVEILDITDPTNGTTIGTITDDETWSLSAGTIYYSVRFVNAVGATYVIDMGKIKIMEALSSRLS